MEHEGVLPVSNRVNRIVAVTIRIIVAFLLGLFVLAVGGMVLTLLQISPVLITCRLLVKAFIFQIMII